MARRLGLVLVLLMPLAGGPACEHNTVTAPALTATCAASPGNGAAPLSVAFTLSVAGAQGSFTVAIDYGDGKQGSDPGQPHVYAGAGVYSPSFTVATATQSARCSTAVTVNASPSPSPLANQPPDAVFHTVPAASGETISGVAPLEVHFNMCQTADPEGDKLLFKMDLDGDGVFEVAGSTGGECRKSTTYAAGTHRARICVTDVDCATWPTCREAPTLHDFQCRNYSVVVSP